MTSEKVLIGGDFNSHVGSDLSVSGIIHRGFGIGK